jgi:hypothetical protein
MRKMMGRQITGHTKVHFTGTLFFILLGGLVFFSCELMLPIEIDFDTDTFNQERAAWEEQGIVDYTVREKGTGALSFRNTYITVRDNAIIDDDLPESQSSNRSRLNLKTISEIYTYVDQIYGEALERIEADKGKIEGLRSIIITVTYNMEFHYPQHVRISRSYRRISIGDGGGPPTVLWLSEFTPLAPVE